ncbi:hypothetical protein [Nonomuraea sp. SYSU D8015]|nr:hypothetical protein [Nonomuraea sp. SYSU D8015]
MPRGRAPARHALTTTALCVTVMNAQRPTACGEPAKRVRVPGALPK